MPLGVHGRGSGMRWARRPTLYGWRPSTSLSGRIRSSSIGRVQVLRQWQLQQDAVDCRIVVEAVDQVGQRFLSGFGRQVIGLGDEADLFTVFTLVRDINLRGRIAADQDHREAGRAQALLATLVDPLGDLLAQAGGDRFAVD